MGKSRFKVNMKGRKRDDTRSTKATLSLANSSVRGTTKGAAVGKKPS